MKKLYKRFDIILILLLIIVLLVVSQKTKSSFQVTNLESETEINLMDFQVYNSNVNDIYYNKIDNADTIFNESPIIAKVKMTNEREYLNQCILSTVDIVKVYKNTTNINLTNEMYIYEPTDVRSNELVMYTTNGYIPMISDNEYIVFLTPLKVPDGYRMSSVEEKSFMFYNAEMGKVSVNKLEPYITGEFDLTQMINNLVSYKDLINYDVILDESKSTTYKEFKEKVYKNYN